MDLELSIDPGLTCTPNLLPQPSECGDYRRTYHLEGLRTFIFGILQAVDHFGHILGFVIQDRHNNFGP